MGSFLLAVAVVAIVVACVAVVVWCMGVARVETLRADDDRRMIAAEDRRLLRELQKHLNEQEAGEQT
jgi:hypothetical protein